MQKFLCVIAGPTGVGKTDFALSLAQLLPSVILNADMGQFYTPLTIGTAKPDWRNQPVPHYLFDILSEPENYSVKRFREDVISQAERSWQKKTIPLLVGGSGFYTQSLMYPPLSNPPLEDSTRSNMLKIYSWDELNRIDPLRAQKIHPHDTYRISRAIDLWHSTGVRPSELVPRYDPPASLLILFVNRQRDELYERINQRVRIMLNAGWIEEVSNLSDQWKKLVRDKNILGYSEIIDYLDGKLSRSNLEEAIAQQTRAYAKRQLTFGRLLKKVASQTPRAPYPVEFREIDLTFLDVNLYLKQLSSELYGKIEIL